jgi:hypothetical protein
MGFRRNATIDTLLELEDGAGAFTASAAGSDILDMGATNVGHNNDAGPGRVTGDIMIDVTAMDIVSNDEIYDIVLQGSPDALFDTAANVQELAAISLGCSEAKRTDSDKDDVIGRYKIPVRNEFMETVYRYLRLYVVAAGTTPSITFTAYFVKRD